MPSPSSASEADIAYFSSRPAFHALLQSPTLELRTPSSRDPKSSTEDSLFAQTFYTPSTIHAALSYYERPAPSAAQIESVTTLLALGEALNGFPHLLHGGVVASILDEAMGILLSLNQERAHFRAVAEGKRDGGVPEALGCFTAELKVVYVRPVRTPGVVVARAWFVRREGRKTWIWAEVRDEGGEVKAKGEALFVEPRQRKL
ncbi:hypothetical protein LTR50_004615 [Elasticomyces elasticus]|nr:hypothetical protein LTR50_004615 [Elasticomyces elasticus]